MSIKTNHIERYYDSHEVEGAELTQSLAHYAVIKYLALVLEWIFQNINVGVSSNVNIYQSEHPIETPISPDLAVVDGLIVEEHNPDVTNSYYMSKENPPPKVVFEICSKETWRQDLLEKPAKYNAMGVNEYFAYDPNSQPLWTGQWRKHNQLIGWRKNLASGEFELITKDRNSRLWSEELQSWLVVEPTGLRLYNTEGQLRLTEAEALQQSLELERSEKEAEARRANNAEREKQKLAEKLREMGINPEELL